MRDDLLDAHAAVDWAIAQVKLFEAALASWQDSRPYRIMQQVDPESADHHLIVAVEEKPLPLTFNAWLGAILNSIRSSLDLVASALATRNGKRPSSDRHFPIFASELDMIDPLCGLNNKERKEWLSDEDRTAIKALKPYKGGNDSIWPLHHLDIVRKHERLLFANPALHGLLVLGGGRMYVFGMKAIERRHDKTILGRIGREDSIPITESNPYLALDILINETAIGLEDEQVLPALRRFWLGVTEVISLFDN
jgi:hypothetical protein